MDGEAAGPWESLEEKRVVVTGTTGFVGPHLVRALIDEGAQVFGASNQEARISDDDHYHHTVCDVRRPADVQNLLSIAEPHGVIHLAAQSHVPSAWENPERTFRINVMGTLHLARACSEVRNPPRFLFVSTGEVYGKPDRVPIDEDAPFKPNNPYAASKVAAEMALRPFGQAGRMEVVIARPFNHTGPGQSPKFVAPAFAEQIARIEAGLQEPIMRVGDLTPKRDFSDVRDVVQAYLRILCEGESGDVFNIASGEPVAIADLLSTMLERTTANIVVEADPERFRPSDTPIIAGDPTRLRERTGWGPQWDLEETVEDLLDEARERLEAPSRG